MGHEGVRQFRNLVGGTLATAGLVIGMIGLVAVAVDHSTTTVVLLVVALPVSLLLFWLGWLLRYRHDMKRGRLSPARNFTGQAALFYGVGAVFIAARLAVGALGEDWLILLAALALGAAGVWSARFGWRTVHPHQRRG